MALVLLVCAVVLVAALAWLRWRHLGPLLAAAAKCRGPPALPFLGNALSFLGDTDNIMATLEDLFVSYPTHESPGRFWLGPKLYFFLAAPDHIERILNAPETMGKDTNYDFAKVWVGEGLITAPVPKWKRHRRVISPSFNQRVLDTFVPLFREQNARLVQKLSAVADGTTFNCFDYLSRCTLDIVCETVMGVGVGAQTNEESEYVKATQSQLVITVKRIMQIWFASPLLFRLSGLERVQEDNIRVLHGFSQRVVEAKMNKRKDETADPAVRKSFLDHIIASTQQEGEKAWSEQELREEVDTMIVAGTDTSASMACFTLMTLGMHPDVQEKVVDELRQILGNERGEMTVEDLSRMTYLELVIKESMRLFPVAPFILRYVSSDLKLTEDLTLPSGSGLFIGIRSVQKDPRYWGADADQFRPERFLSMDARHPYAYIPFAGGPRNCIGQRYAMMSMKVMLASVLQNFVVRCDCDVANLPLKLDIVLRPVHGFNISITKRIS